MLWISALFTLGPKELQIDQLICGLWMIASI
jgi:hypothetical protein